MGRANADRTPSSGSARAVQAAGRQRRSSRAPRSAPRTCWTGSRCGPDGGDYPNWIEWPDIVSPERIVALHGSRADDPDAFVSTFTFVERDGATDVTLRSVFPTKALRDQVIEEFRAIEGAEQTLGRLAGYLEGAARNR